MAINKKGDSQEFSYTGDIQSITLTKSGLYKLEAYGAGTSMSAYGESASAKGGYVCGYKMLEAGTKLYIGVGGSNGYNGGGASTGYHDPVYAYVSCSSGGGATHIGKVDGQLPAIGETSFVTNGNGFLIAGGAGGCEAYTLASAISGAAAGGAGGTGGNNNTFGKGSDCYVSEPYHGCGGGAGYRGGARATGSGSQPGGGGSGGSNWNAGCPAITYKGQTYSPSASSGTRSGNGLARITLEEVTSDVKYGTKDTSVFYGTKEVTVYYGDKQL